MATPPPYQHFQEFYQRNMLEGQPVQFVPDEMQGEQRLLQIMLIRHGEPLVQRKGWANVQQARKFLADYDSVGIKTFTHKVVKLHPGEVPQIYTSNLPRARHTAELIFGDTFPLVQDKQFREMERKLVALPYIRMPLKLWTITARVPWLFGLSRQTESFRKAFIRTKKATTFLEKEARSNDNAVLVAHGLLNRFLSLHLRRRGWQRVYHQGYGFLGISVLVKFSS